MDYCFLPDQGLLIVSGADAAAFMQGQLTNDVRSLRSDAVMVAACNSPQGRVVALVRVVERDGALWLLLPRALAAPVAERLRRYVLRAKVQLRVATDEFAFAALPGDAGDAAMPAHVRGPGTLSRIRFRAGTLLVGSADDVRAAVAAGHEVPASAWSAAAIAAGEPEVPAEASEEWIAQMLNLDLLDGISFTKGCYTGQEIVARTQHLGRIKRRAFRYRAAGVHAVAVKQALLLDGTKVGEAIASAPAGDGTELLAVVALEHRERTLSTEDGVSWAPAPLPYPIP
jgi:folate-binding protein YgfZ